jgi:hypothetical protein
MNLTINVCYPNIISLLFFLMETVLVHTWTNIFNTSTVESQSKSVRSNVQFHRSLPFSLLVKVKGQSYIATDGRSISKSWCRAPSGAHDQVFIIVWQLRSCFVGRPLWREDVSVFCICCWPSPAQSFSGPSPVGLATIFYCLRFETSFLSPPTTRRATLEVFDPASTREASLSISFLDFICWLLSLYITFQPTEYATPFPTVNLIASLCCCALNDSLPWISAFST